MRLLKAKRSSGLDSSSTKNILLLVFLQMKDFDDEPNANEIDDNESICSTFSGNEEFGWSETSPGRRKFLDRWKATHSRKHSDITEQPMLKSPVRPVPPGSGNPETKAIGFHAHERLNCLSKFQRLTAHVADPKQLLRKYTKTRWHKGHLPDQAFVYTNK